MIYSTLIKLTEYRSLVEGEIFHEHWEELALDKDKAPFDPQYEVYQQREDDGMLLILCIFDRKPHERGRGELVGYFLGFIAPGLHYQQTLTCTMDIFYIRQKYRDNLLLSRRLFRAVERELKTRGVHRWFVGSKLHRDVGRLFKSLKFEPVETYYSKWIGE